MFDLKLQDKMKRVFDASLKMRLSQLSPTTERAHSAGLRWGLLFGLGFLLMVGIEEARGFAHYELRVFAYFFYVFLAGIVLAVWLERITIDSRGIYAVSVFGRNQIRWGDIEVVEYPWRVSGKLAWAYREYARIELKTGKVKSVAIAGDRASLVLRQIMK
jgi:hypothetical protein